jgi:hypothetical protein
VKILTLLLFLFVFPSFACDHKSQPEFKPFAREIQNYPQYKTYFVYFPEDDKAQKKMYFSGLSAHVDKLFIIDLADGESHDYAGYYSGILAIDPSIIEKVMITGSYNANNKEKTSLSFCGNWKTYKLTDLLLAPEAPKRK